MSKRWVTARPPLRRGSGPTGRQRAVAERTIRTILRRRIVNIVMTGIVALAALLTTLPLLFILFHLARQGAGALSLDFLRRCPSPSAKGTAASRTRSWAH